MPAESPAGLPETFLGADLGAAQPLECRARPALVQQLPRGGVSLRGAPQRLSAGARIALGEQQLGACLRYGSGPRAAWPDGCALFRARQELARGFERAGARARARSAGTRAAGASAIAAP